VGKRPGDVLVFLPGEREIREAAEMLRKANLRFTEVLPLYARLTPGEQQKIFKPAAGRKIVLATNVAETSLTVPGIRYVIDSGTARISRYSYRAKVQRLPIEAVSQASANQRKGRCGRVEPGICIRLYSEEDFLSRPEFTDPEILRTNLAAVILQMLHLRLGDIQDFPFIEPPDGKAISDGFNLLQELSAVNRENQLTPLGRQLARLPIDPRLGRMMLEAAQQGSLAEVLIVASALSVQDVRERPADRQQQADQAHAQWKDPDSDFAALINLWRGFEEKRQELGSNPLRSWCRKNFLNYLRLREWRDAHRQLTLIARELKLGAGKAVDGSGHPPYAKSGSRRVENAEGFSTRPAEAVPTTDTKVNAIVRQQAEASEAAQKAKGYAAVHKAILAGLLSQIGHKTEEGDFLGARQRRFWVHPSSVIGRKKPSWIMAAELVETTKLFARMVAKIEPDWIEPLAGHLIKKNHFEPHWEKKRGQVVA
ncbi:MAG TPA: ATP-dependent RNA helicase HrpA, partial [Pseudomonas sp.]|nr:ATP-dependent RNA helicase HrpA [Pseudomonas sp.]